MKRESSVEVRKWGEIQQLLSADQEEKSITSIRYKRWFVDNFFIFLIQLAGYSLNQSVIGQPFILLATGAGLAILLLKGDVILPGLCASVLISSYLGNGTVSSTHFDYVGIQVFPLLCLKYYIHYLLGATLLDLTVRKQLLLYVGIFVTAFLMTIDTFRLTTFFATVNGILVMSVTVLMADLYFVDWYTVKSDEWKKLGMLYFLWALFILLLFLTIHFLLIQLVLLLLSLFVIYMIYKHIGVLGVVGVLLIFAFMQLCSSFFVSYQVNDMSFLQGFLFVDTVFAMYLMRKRSIH